MGNEVAPLKDNALTTLEQVKQMLGIPEDELSPESTDEERSTVLIRDNIIVNMINAASAWFESQTGRNFKLAKYKERYQGSSSQELCLRQYPIVSVERVTDTTAGTDFNPSQYSIEYRGHIGVIWKDDGWALQSYNYGLAFDPLFSKRYLEVEYTAGYVLPKDATEDNPSTLPSDIEAVIWEMAQQQYKLMQDGAFNLASFSISDVSWTWDKEQKQSWLDTIAAYKRWM